jgi:hypothetical protein
MTNRGTPSGEVFRPSAARLFIFFYVVVSLPCLVCFSFIRYGAAFQWQELLLGAAFIVPLALLSAGIVSLFLPVRLTAEGIHAHSAWNLPRFIRWQDIKSVRKFNLPILRWLLLYSANGSSAVWLIMFQSSPAKFKLELQKLAPPGNPILSHLD